MFQVGEWEPRPDRFSVGLRLRPEEAHGPESMSRAELEIGYGLSIQTAGGGGYGG